MNALGVAALVTWLIAVALDLYLLSPWLDDKSGTVSRPALIGHLVLGIGGLASWLRFVLAGSVGFAWLAIALLVPAIGLGISIARGWRAMAGRRSGPGGGAQPAIFGITSDEMLARALEDEALTTKLVDDLLANVLAPAASAARLSVRRPSTLVAVTHGTLVMTTFLVAVLAAVTAS